MVDAMRIRFVTIIIILNLIVFGAWVTAKTQEQLYFMTANFLVSWLHLEAGRYWTLVTSVFSHKDLWHFLINMFVLQSFGTIVEQVLGSMRFLTFYLLAGIVSSLAHCLVSAFYLDQPSIPALGASGAISGLVLIFALLFPKEKILIFGIIPIPALIGALAFIGLDFWGLSAQASGGGLPIGHGAHLGGALTGIIYYFLFLRHNRRKFLGGT